jgi:hypothetical protein
MLVSDTKTAIGAGLDLFFGLGVYCTYSTGYLYCGFVLVVVDDLKIFNELEFKK